MNKVGKIPTYIYKLNKEMIPMGYFKKALALVVAIVMMFSIAVSASACGPTDWFFNRAKTQMPAVSFADVLANIQKSIAGTGLVYGRDYKVDFECDGVFGYRVHLIQPVSGNTLYDNYLLYKDGKWTWEKEWNLPTLPTCDQFNLENIVNNIYTALWDSGIYIDINKDISVTRESQDGFKVLIVDPITGKTIFDKQFVIENCTTIDWSCEFEPISEDCIISAHFPTTDEATEEMIEEAEEPVVDEPTNDEPVTEETTEIETVVVDDSTPLGAVPAEDAPAEEIANTGDTAFATMGIVAMVAAAAFVATKKF